MQIVLLAVFSAVVVTALPSGSLHARTDLCGAVRCLSVPNAVVSCEQDKCVVSESQRTLASRVEYL